MIGEFPLGVKAVLKEGACPLPPEETVNPEPYLYWIFGLTLFGGEVELGQELLASLQECFSMFPGLLRP